MRVLFLIFLAFGLASTTNQPCGASEHYTSYEGSIEAEGPTKVYLDYCISDWLKGILTYDIAFNEGDSCISFIPFYDITNNCTIRPNASNAYANTPSNEGPPNASNAYASPNGCSYTTKPVIFKPSDITYILFTLPPNTSISYYIGSIYQWTPAPSSDSKHKPWYEENGYIYFLWLPLGTFLSTLLCACCYTFLVRKRGDMYRPINF